MLGMLQRHQRQVHRHGHARQTFALMRTLQAHEQRCGRRDVELISYKCRYDGCRAQFGKRNRLSEHVRVKHAADPAPPPLRMYARTVIKPSAIISRYTAQATV